MIIAALFFTACSENKGAADASGTFEADEVIVSAELPGKLLSFKVEEGETISKDSVVGEIDALNLALQKEQVEASIRALGEKTVDVKPNIQMLQDQLSVQQSQFDNLLHEKNRIESLLKQDAATGKQLDDINAQIDILKKQMGVTRQQVNVQKNTVATQNRAVLSEGKPLQKRVAQIDEQLQKASIVNPVTGTVIAKYAAAGEITAAGKALYRIADLSVMTLRAYITGSQLAMVKLGQSVTVRVDDSAGKYKNFAGTIAWVSGKAEFTPKTIQTRDERANLVYAVKIKVKNDGYLKIGMYGEVLLSAAQPTP